MITEDEVMSLLQRADPARRLVAAPDADAAAYLDSLRARSRDVTLIDTEPEEIQPDEVAADPRRLPPWTYAVTGGVIAAGLVAVLAFVGQESRESHRTVAPLAANGLIAFAGNPGDSTRSDIYLVAPDGNGLRPLTSTPELVEFAPTWSSDGRRLAFVRTEVPESPAPCRTHCQLVVVDPSSGIETFSTDIPQPDGAGGGTWEPSSLAWSPDGRKIVIPSVACGVGGCGSSVYNTSAATQAEACDPRGCGGQNSVIADLESGAFTTFTPQYHAVWSPDGEWLSLAQAPLLPGPSLLLVPTDAIGTGDVDVTELPGVRTLPEGPNAGGVDVAWMPDGSTLLFSNGTRIDEVTIADGQIRTLIEEGSSPIVSPDGSQVAYVREAASGEGNETWVAAADGSDPRLVTVSFTPPAWSPDGNRLLASDEAGWFTVLADGAGRTEVTPFLRPDPLTICCPDNRPSWQALPPGRSPPTEPSAVEIATGFLAAYGAYDADRALSYLADEAIDDARPVELAGTPEEFRRELAVVEAFRYQQTITGCEQEGDSPSGIAIRCAFDMHEFGSDELGLGPYTGNYWDLIVRDGKLTSASSSWAFRTNGSSLERWEPFASWVQTNHPNDMPVLYADGSLTRFAISDEAIVLLEERVDEFVAQELAGLEAARELMDAWVAGDGDAVADLFAPDGMWEDVAADQIPARHDWLRVVGADHRGDACDLRTTVESRCDYTVENDLSRFLGVGPIANRFVVTVQDGQITRVDEVPNEQLDEIWSTFADWVAGEHADDVEQMFVADTTMPRLDAASIELWNRYVDEFTAREDG